MTVGGAAPWMEGERGDRVDGEERKWRIPRTSTVHT
jgi:hypothetical protein